MKDFYNEKKEKILKMVDKGMQIPLNKLFSTKKISSLEISEHVVNRYNERFRLDCRISIEKDILCSLQEEAYIIERGYSGRFLVSTINFIFILSDDSVVTVYEINGENKKNIKDKSERYLKKINKENQLDILFKQIKKNG